MARKLKTQDQIIRKFMKIAKVTMKELNFAMPCTPLGDIWHALFATVDDAKKLGYK